VNKTIVLATEMLWLTNQIQAF